MWHICETKVAFWGLGCSSEASGWVSLIEVYALDLHDWVGVGGLMLGRSCWVSWEAGVKEVWWIKLILTSSVHHYLMNYNWPGGSGMERERRRRSGGKRTEIDWCCSSFGITFRMFSECGIRIVKWEYLQYKNILQGFVRCSDKKIVVFHLINKGFIQCFSKYSVSATSHFDRFYTSGLFGLIDARTVSMDERKQRHLLKVNRMSCPLSLTDRWSLGVWHKNTAEKRKERLNCGSTCFFSIILYMTKSTLNGYLNISAG